MTHDLEYLTVYFHIYRKDSGATDGTPVQSFGIQYNRFAKLQSF